MEVGIFLLIIVAAGIFRAINAARNPTSFADYARRKYQDKIDRHSGKGEAALLDEVKIELNQRRSQIDVLGVEIDGLMHEKIKTKTEIFAIIDRFSSIGIAANNRKKYFLDLFLSFAFGITTSIIGSYIWNYFHE